MSTPTATESPPKPAQSPPVAEPKVLNFTKVEGSKWVLTMSGKIKQADINHLKRFLKLEFVRAKRRERQTRNALARKESADATK